MKVFKDFLKCSVSKNKKKKVIEKSSQLSIGKKVEQEHKPTIKKIKEGKVKEKDIPESIAKDHLKESKDYYSKLVAMEKFDKLTGIEKKIVDTIKNAKKMDDEKVIHTLAEKLKMNPHRLEEKIYKMFKKVL